MQSLYLSEFLFISIFPRVLLHLQLVLMLMPAIYAKLYTNLYAIARYHLYRKYRTFSVLWP
jgi:hypothetical protein